MATAFSSALYYPYIDIRNERWLRTASLFWDSIGTIVPKSYPDPYSNDFARALHDEGVLQPVRVSSEMKEIEELRDKVLDFLRSSESEEIIFGADQNGARRIHSEKMFHEFFYRARVHFEKFPAAIFDELERGPDKDGWLHFPPGFVDFYMTLLATQLAKRFGLGLITDSPPADQLAINVQKKERRIASRRASSANIAPSLLVDLMIQGVLLPENLPAKDILRFKKAHNEELAVFRQEITQLTSGLPQDMPLDALRQAVMDMYKANVLPAMKSLRQSLRAENWDIGNSLLKVSFFSVAPTSVALYAGVPSSVALLAGAGISLAASVITSANKRRKIKNENPYTYLLEMERKW